MKLTPHNIPPPNRKFLGSGEQMTNSLVSTFRGNIAHFYTFFFCEHHCYYQSQLGLEVFPGLPLLSFICESVFQRDGGILSNPQI